MGLGYLALLTPGGSFSNGSSFGAACCFHPLGGSRACCLLCLAQ